jgi:uncharacterized protein YegP (UPF0339 family)
MESSMTKTTHQPRLEVFPEQRLVPTDGAIGADLEYETKYRVRLVAGNGAKLMVSPGYDSAGTRSNGIRAARSINRITETPEFPNGRLHIRVLDEEGKVERIIEPEQVEPGFVNGLTGEALDIGIGDE